MVFALVVPVAAMSQRGDSTGLVSVIVPFLDTPEDFFREAIQSVQAQVYKKWELILVDDGSVPAVRELAEELVRENPLRIICLEHDGHQNRGSSASRNLGLRFAKGEFISFLDSDDVWVETKLMEQVELLESHPEVGMLYGNALCWFGWTGKMTDARRDHQFRLGLHVPQIVQPPNLLRYSLQGRAAVPSMSNIIIRRGALQAGDWFEEDFPGMYDDQVFFAKVWVNQPVYVVNRCWNKYRQHPESMTAGTEGSRSQEEARLAYLRWLLLYLTKHNLQGSPVWKTLANELKVQESLLPASLIRKIRRIFWKIFNLFWPA